MATSKMETKPLAIGLLTLLTITAYSNSWHASWHLDDFPNIVLNDTLHLQQMDPSAIVDTFFASPSGKLYRPLPMLSFALNWYFHGLDVVGYHAVNVAIHCINGILLYLFILKLLQLPFFRPRLTTRQGHWISLLAACLWVVHPVQTQAVTYIVQRMTSMATMFYLAGILLYLHARMVAVIRKRIGWLLGSFICYVLAVLSKENAIVLPLSILLIEAVFFDHRDVWGWMRRRGVVIGSIVTAAMVLLVIGIFFDWQNPVEKISAIYAQRSFTPLQRLMTESRVLVYYLTLMIIPLSERFSLCHDVSLSTSLLAPPTTILSIGFHLLLIAGCIRWRRSRPLFAFGVLFFYVNHLVESTILPLELVFDHRNYLPSLFIFLPVAALIVKRTGVWAQRRASYRTLAAAGICLTVGWLVNETFSRNLVWSDEKTLWEYEIAQHPMLARPHHNLAWGHYQAVGKYGEARRLYEKALSLKADSTIERIRTLNNLGRVYYQLGEYALALSTFTAVIQLDADMHLARYQQAMTLIQLQQWQQASAIIDHLVAINYSRLDLHRLRGIIHMHQGEPAAAVRDFQASRQRDPSSIETVVHLSMALFRAGRSDLAKTLLRKSTGIDSDSPPPLALIASAEIARLTGNIEAMHRYVVRFSRLQSLGTPRDLLQQWANDQTMPIIDYQHYVRLVEGRQTAAYESSLVTFPACACSGIRTQLKGNTG